MAPSAIESLDEPDLLARQFTRIVGAVTVLLGSGALILLFSRQWIPALVMAVLAVPIGMLTKRLSLNIPATVRLDGGGIHRKGTYGWSVPWGELEYAGIHPYDGAHVLVAVPRRHVSHWSRTLRLKDQVLTEDLGPLPEGGYVAPVFDELAWDMEHYIAGHLPGHPGFDPARLHLPPHLMRSQYDDGEAASPGTPTTRRATPRPDPVAVRAADPLPRRQARMFGLLALLALAFAVVSWFMLRDPVQGFTRSQIAAIVALGIAAAFLAYRAYAARLARDSVVVVSERGISRLGPWGWEHTWRQIASATVEEFNGSHYLVVVRRDESAPYHRSATALAGHPFPGNALISPVPEASTAQLEEALRTFRRGQ